MKIFLLMILLLINFAIKSSQAKIDITGFVKQDVDSKINIVSSINPLYQIISSITEDKTNNYLIFKSNFSEHNYQLKSDDVKVLQKADLIFIIDKNYEKNIFKLVNNYHQLNKIIIASEIDKIKLFNLRNNSNLLDHHLWLDPQNAELIAYSLVENLCKIDQINCKFYHKNFVKFQKQNQQLFLKINQRLKFIRSRDFIFYHDCYQYFEEYFKISPKLIIDYDHAIDLKMSKLRTLDDVIKNNQIKCLFGDINDEKNSASKIAKNYKINFSNLDIIGLNLDNKNSEQKTELNGYSQIIFKLIDNIDNCLK
jgi:zinc transport system substrate-binding protein